MPLKAHTNFLLCAHLDIFGIAQLTPSFHPQKLQQMQKLPEYHTFRVDLKFVDINLKEKNG